MYSLLLYVAKLLSGKTFAVGMQMTIHGKTFMVASHQVISSCVKSIEQLIQQNLQENIQN